MGEHWRLALRYAAWVAAVSVLAGGLAWSYYGGAYAGAMFYGVVVGLTSFVSTAASVSWITGRSELLRALGAGTFFLRYGFVAVALGVPAYLGLWPAVAMLAGFSGVYLAENAVLLPGVAKMMSKPSGAGTKVVASEEDRVERRVTV